MTSLLKYLKNVHEVRVMEPLTLLQGLKQLDFHNKSIKHLWIAYKKRLKEVAPSIDFNQLSILIKNIPFSLDRNFILFDSLVNNLINKSLIGQLETHKSLINLLKYFKSIEYSNPAFTQYVINYFDHLALSKLNLPMLSDLCNNLDNSTEEFNSKLSNTFHFLLESTDLDNSTFIILDSAAKCLIGLSKLSNGLDRDLSDIGTKLLGKLDSSSYLTKLQLINSLITQNYDLELFDNHAKQVLAKISYENVSKDLIINLLKLSLKINLSAYNFSPCEFIINSINSNLIIFNGVNAIEPLQLCISLNNSEIALRIIDNMKFGKLDYNDSLALLDCFYRLKDKFKIEIAKSGYLMDRINYQLTFKPEVSLYKQLKLGYVEQQKSQISDELLPTLCYISSIAAEFSESFGSAQNLVISILDNIESHKLWSKLTPINMYNLLFSLSRLRIRRVDSLDSISSHLIGLNIDSDLSLKIIKSFAELSYPWVEYFDIVSRGKKYLTSKFPTSSNLDSLLTKINNIDKTHNDYLLKINFLYGFATKSNFVPFRLNKLVNRNLWNLPFTWFHLFKESNADTHEKALNKLEKMITDNGYKVHKKNVKWKGLFNVDILAKSPNKPRHLTAINLLMPNDFYTDGSVLARKRLQLHLLALDIDTLNVHYEQVLKYRRNIASKVNNSD